MKNPKRALMGVLFLFGLAFLILWNRKAGLYVGGATLLGVIVYMSGNRL